MQPDRCCASFAGYATQFLVARLVDLDALGLAGLQDEVPPQERAGKQAVHGNPSLVGRAGIGDAAPMD